MSILDNFTKQTKTSITRHAIGSIELQDIQRKSVSEEKYEANICELRKTEFNDAN